MGIEESTFGIKVSFEVSWEEDSYPSAFSRTLRSANWSRKRFSSWIICINIKCNEEK